MNHKHILSLTAAAFLSTAAAMPAAAYEAGDWIVRIGGSNIAPKQDNGDILGLGITVDDDSTLSITGEYMVSPVFGIELLASTPFEHDVSVAGIQVSTVKHLPPTLSLNYHFDTGMDLKPYVGVGLNYTTFFSEKNTQGFVALDGALGGSTPVAGDPKLTLDDSFGIALQAGVDLMVNESTSINVGVRWIDIDADILLNGADTGVSAEIDPLVYTLSIGYKF